MQAQIKDTDSTRTKTRIFNVLPQTESRKYINLKLKSCRHVGGIFSVYEEQAKIKNKLDPRLS